MARNQYRRANRYLVFARPPLHARSGIGASPLPINPVGIVIDQAPFNMNVGETAQLSATFFDQNGDPISGLARVLTWSSSAATVASVSTIGLVTGVGPGASGIRALSAADNLSSVITITVTTPQLLPSTITISPTQFNRVSGTTALVTCQVLSSGGTPITGQVVTWSSSNTNVFTVGSDSTGSDPTHKCVLSFLTASSSTETLTASA